MRLALQEGRTSQEISWGAWELVLHGDAVDDRGEIVLRDVSARVPSMIVVRYRPDDSTFNCAERRKKCGYSGL